MGTKIKRPGSEADPPFSAEVKIGGAIPPLPNTSLWSYAKSIKYGDNFHI
jgi:hypothetical protein